MLTQSPFLQALGFAIVSSLWQYSLIWLMYVLSGIFRPTAAKKFITAFILQFAGLGCFIATFFYYYSRCINALDVTTATPIFSFEHTFFASISTKHFISEIILKSEILLPYLSIAYMIFLFAVCIKNIEGYKQTQRLRNDGIIKIPVEWRLFVNKIAMQFGIKQPVEIAISSIVKSPMTLGFLKPIILLPVAMLNHLDIKQVESILVHELAHISRHDYINNLLISIVAVVLFFNPFAQLLCKHLKQEREHCCDDCVLDYKYNAASYATALLIVARNTPLQLAPFSMPAISGDRDLLNRVKRIIGKKREINYKNQLIALSFFVCILYTLALLTQAKYEIDNRLQASNFTNTSLRPQTPSIQNQITNPLFFIPEIGNGTNLERKTSNTKTFTSDSAEALLFKRKSGTKTTLTVATKSEANYIASQVNIVDSIASTSADWLAENNTAKFYQNDAGINNQSIDAGSSNVQQVILDNVISSTPAIPKYIQIFADVPDEVLPLAPIAEPWSYSYNEKPRVIILPNISATFTIPSEISERRDLHYAPAFKGQEASDNSAKKKITKLKRKVIVRI